MNDNFKFFNCVMSEFIKTCDREVTAFSIGVLKKMFSLNVVGKIWVVEHPVHPLILKIPVQTFFCTNPIISINHAMPR